MSSAPGATAIRRAPLAAEALPESGSLRVRVGYASERGRREANEDYFGFVEPQAPEQASRGVLLAVADGLGGHAGGAEAAEYTVRGLLADYYSTPETWGIALALDRVISALNRWLLSQAAARRELTGMATTLSALVLRGSRYCLAHVGDSRIYRLEANQCRQLTTDHVWDRAEMDHVLTRAVGMDAHLVIDYADGDLQAGEVFLLCSDGLWSALDAARMAALLSRQEDPQQSARDLVQAALDAGSSDNVTALVVRVDAVGGGLWRDLLGSDRSLPLPGRLRPGQQVDGLEVLETLHESRATLLYLVREPHTGRRLALKTLQPHLAGDPVSCEGLLAEEWLAKRLVSACFAQVIPLPPGQRSFLYYLATYHEGANLQQQLDEGRHFAVADVVRTGIALARGLGSLHRLSILHRDIKPANLLEGSDGTLRILDLGVALAGGVPYPELEGNPGTPSYMAPELFAGERASVRSDLYAAGVTLYQLLTRQFPYGEVEPFQHPRFGEPRRPTRYRPDVPAWLENLLLRALSRDPGQRFETAEELLLALERAQIDPVSAPRPRPLAGDPLRRWQAVAVLAVSLNLLLLYYILLR